MNLTSNDIIFVVISKILNQESYDVVIQIVKFNY